MPVLSDEAIEALLAIPEIRAIIERCAERLQTIHSPERPFVFCPYCGRRLVIVFAAHSCVRSDFD